jgi:hypothetical protein
VVRVEVDIVQAKIQANGPSYEHAERDDDKEYRTDVRDCGEIPEGSFDSGWK